MSDSNDAEREAMPAIDPERIKAAVDRVLSPWKEILDISEAETAGCPQCKRPITMSAGQMEARCECGAEVLRYPKEMGMG